MVQYIKVVASSVAREGEPTKSGYLTFDTGGMSKINWIPTVVQVLESSRAHRDETSSDNIQNPSGSSTILIPEESFKRLTCTPILGEFHPTMGTKRLAQPDISAINLDESSSMPIAKGMDIV